MPTKQLSSTRTKNKHQRTVTLTRVLVLVPEYLVRNSTNPGVNKSVVGCKKSARVAALICTAPMPPENGPDAFTKPRPSWSAVVNVLFVPYKLSEFVSCTRSTRHDVLFSAPATVGDRPLPWYVEKSKSSSTCSAACAAAASRDRVKTPIIFLLSFFETRRFRSGSENRESLSIELSDLSPNTANKYMHFSLLVRPIGHPKINASRRSSTVSTASRRTNNAITTVIKNQTNNVPHCRCCCCCCCCCG